MASDAILRRWVTWLGVVGTVVLGAFFFGFMIYQTVRGESEPANWLIKITQTNYAALVGVPMSAVTAFCIVSLLKVTNGPIEFEALGFKFRGASGPIVLWVLCFLAIVVAFRVLWPMAPNQTMQRNTGRSAFPLPMTSTSNLQPRSPSPAVADLVSR